MNDPQVNHFFVDEAGDLTFFGKGGRVVVGKQGVSNFFMVGVAEIPDPGFVDALLSELRTELLADPYFKGVPSMQPGAGKTARAFHGSKDPPEVRRDVIARLSLAKAKVFVAIRRKHTLVEQIRQPPTANRKQLTLRRVYEDLVSRLFRNKLHKADRNEIVFAKHPTWTRREALSLAIRKAKTNFERKTGLSSDKPTGIRAAEPHEFGGLQVVDYYLWAIQRMYERGEDRFFESLRHAYRLIMDLDDTANRPYGEWYSDSNPLTLERITPPAD